MRQEEFQIGDRAVIIDRRGPWKVSKVTAVKQYQRGPKVTLADGSEWDVHGTCSWGQRGELFRVLHISAWTPELQATLTDRQRVNALRWAVDHWDELTPEQQASVGDAARAARREGR